MAEAEAEADEIVRTLTGLPTSEVLRLAAPEPLAADKAWEQAGWASWYGGRFHGRLTASGERFDVKAMTAAHPTLPMGTWLEVLNPVNGRRVVVRINDRGPHVKGVFLDLSQQAATHLGFVRNGRAWVLARMANPKTR